MHRCCKYLLYYNNITVTVILIHHLRRNSVGETVVNKPKDKARRTMLQDVSEVRSQKFCGQGVRSGVGYRDASARTVILCLTLQAWIHVSAKL